MSPPGKSERSLERNGNQRSVNDGGIARGDVHAGIRERENIAVRPETKIRVSNESGSESTKTAPNLTTAVPGPDVLERGTTPVSPSAKRAAPCGDTRRRSVSPEANPLSAVFAVIPRESRRIPVAESNVEGKDSRSARARGVPAEESVRSRNPQRIVKSIVGSGHEPHSGGSRGSPVRQEIIPANSGLPDSALFPLA